MPNQPTSSIEHQTMVNSKSNSAEKGRTVEVSNDIPSNKLEGLIGADAYGAFPASTTMAFETYSQRADALSKNLGNKDSVKG